MKMKMKMVTMRTPCNTEDDIHEHVILTKTSRRLERWTRIIFWTDQTCTYRQKVRRSCGLFFGQIGCKSWLQGLCFKRWKRSMKTEIRQVSMRIHEWFSSFETYELSEWSLTTFQQSRCDVKLKNMYNILILEFHFPCTAVSTNLPLRFICPQTNRTKPTHRPTKNCCPSLSVSFRAEP